MHSVPHVTTGSVKMTNLSTRPVAKSWNLKATIASVGRRCLPALTASAPFLEFHHVKGVVTGSAITVDQVTTSVWHVLMTLNTRLACTHCQ